MTPRLWLVIWGGLGAAFLGYFLIAASLKPRDAASNSATSCNQPLRDPALAKGEMADFVYAFARRAAPDATFFKDGAPIRLQDFAGKTVLVNFWASWCAPCLKELPSLDGLQQALGSETFEVVAVAADPTGPETARAYLDRLNINNLTFYTDEKLRLASAVGGANVLPISILYDRSGREIGRLVGEADWESEEALALVSAAASCGA